MTGSSIDWYHDAGPLDLVLGATALVFVVNGHQHPPLLVLGAAFLAAMLLRPGWLRSPWPWFVLTAAAVAIDLTRFLELDDHAVLTHYWTLAIGLSLLTRDAAGAIETNGRLLIGLTMAFAVASKVVWGEFVDGHFFEAALLTDDRFEWLARIAGIPDPDANYASFLRVASEGGPVPLVSSGLVRPLALALTVGTLLVEGALAIAYLVPSGAARLLTVRSRLLAIFCVATYGIVPVAGFGSILLVMASAERRHDRPAVLRRLAGAAGLTTWGIVWQVLH